MVFMVLWLALSLFDIVPRSQVWKCLTINHTLGLIPHSQTLRQNIELWFKYWKKNCLCEKKRLKLISFFYFPFGFYIMTSVMTENYWFLHYWISKLFLIMPWQFKSNRGFHRVRTANFTLKKYTKQARNNLWKILKRSLRETIERQFSSSWTWVFNSLKFLLHI